jgi:hypothetical protein
MIFSENRYTLFRIMRWALENGVFASAAGPSGGHFGLSRTPRLALCGRGFQRLDTPMVDSHLMLLAA